MPDSSVAITPGAGALVDSRTVDGEHRQVVVLGDPATAAAVAAILNAAPGASEYGLIVRVAGSVALDAASLAALETVNVTDNGGSLTIDGTVALDPATLSSLETVTVVNINEYVEDAAAAANPAGGMNLAVRQDTLSASTVSADGDNIAMRATAKGELYVKQTDAVPVTDNGGSLTVDGTVAVSGTVPVSGTFYPAAQPVTDNGGSLTVDGTITANAGTGVFDVTPASPVATDYLPVRLTDGTDFYAATGGGGGGAGTEYTEGATDSTITGTAILWEDASDTLRPVSASKPLPVDIQDASVAVTGTFWQTTQPVSGPLTDAQLRASAVPVADGGGSLTVDGTVAATQSGAWNVTNVTGTISLPAGAATSAKQDAIIGHVDGLEGLLGTIDADTGALAGTVAGTEVQVDIVGSLPAGTANIGDVDVASFASGAIAEVQGDVAHDAAASGNPVLMGGYASVAAPANVSGDGDAVRLWADRAGRLQVGDGGGNLSIDDGGNSITVDGSVTATGPLTDAELRATAVPVSGTFWQATQPVSGTVTASGPLTDAQLRATPVPVSGTVTAGLAAGSANIGDVDVLTLPSIPAGTNNIGDVDIASMPSVTIGTELPAGTQVIGNVGARGVVGHDAATTAFPVTIGGYASAAAPAAVSADGDVVRLWSDLNGRLQVGVASALPVGTNNIGDVDVLTLPDVIAVGKAATDAVAAGNPVYNAGRASDAFPSAVSADGDVVPLWLDRRGALFIRPRKIATYSALFRLAARPYALSHTFTANTRKNFASLHHILAATKTIRVHRVTAAVESNSVAAIVAFDLVKLTTGSSNGNPTITPTPHDVSDAASEAIAHALPTTTGTEGALLNSVAFNLGVTGAVPTTNPPAPMNWFTLFEELAGGESKVLTIPAATLGGLAVMVDANAATTLKAYVLMEFSEE